MLVAILFSNILCLEISLEIFAEDPFNSFTTAKYLPRSFSRKVCISFNLKVKDLQSVTKIMGKTAIWKIFCFSPIPPLNNLENQ